MRRREGWHTTTTAHELSDRQRSVLELLAQGRTNFEIAEELGLSLEGAKYHVREIMTKLEVESREEAVAAWRAEQGLARRLKRAVRGLWPLGVVIGGGAIAVGLGLTALVLVGSGAFEGTAPRITPQPSPVANIDAFGNLPARGPLGLLAFVREGQIWVKPLPNGAEVQITSGDQDNLPVLSPSGHWLTFRRGADLWLLDDAGHVRILPPGVAAWAPNDDRLAVVAGGELTILEPASGKTIDLGKAGGASWSPDGAFLAATEATVRSDLAPPSGMAVIDAISGARRELTAALPRGDVRIAGWSGDARQILFWLNPSLSASIASAGVSLYTIPANGGEAVNTNEWQLTYADFVARRPGSSTVAVTTGAGREAWNGKRLAIADLPGVTQPIANAAPGSVGSVAWSPDGSTLAYVAGPEASGVFGGDLAHQALLGRRIYLQEIGGGTSPRKLLDDPNYRDDRAAWSPDGRWLLVSRFDASDTASLWLVSIDGKQATKVADKLGPFDQFGSTWFGFYGHVQWEIAADWRP